MKSLTLLALLVTGLSAVSLFWEFNDETVVESHHAPETVADDATLALVVAVGNRDISAFLSKPIFSETRSALTQYRAQAHMSETTEQVQQLFGQYRLAGVVLTTDQQFAVIHDQKANKAITLALTESVAGWELKQLEPAMATFEQDGKKRQLLLMKDIQPSNDPVAYDEPDLPPVVLVGSEQGVFEDDPYQ